MIDPSLFEQMDMRRALADRDITQVYQLLVQAGISQAQIARQTGQSQSEVSEIISGRRVMAYDVLTRIADGLGIPRGYLGLACADADGALVAYPDDEGELPDRGSEEVADEVINRRLLGLGSLALFGQTVLGEPGALPTPMITATPLPDRVGSADVKQVEEVTARLRALDRQHGGMGVYSSINSHARRAELLLPAASSEGVRRRLAAAVADAHVLSGWSAFDAGGPDKGRAHFGRALTFCEIANDPIVTAGVLYTTARMEIDIDAPDDGLKLLQIGQVGLGRQRPPPVLTAFIGADIGRAYAALGRPDEAREAIQRTTWEGVPGEHNAADLMGITSATQATLGDLDNAAATLHDLLPQRTAASARGLVGELARLSTVYLTMGEVDRGIAAGHRALVTVAAVPGSMRSLHRLTPLRQAAEQRRDSTSRDLAHKIRQVQRSAAVFHRSQRSPAP